VDEDSAAGVDDNARVVFPMHGIMTRADWQRAFTQVAANSGWRVRLNEWNFGRYSLLQFLWPFSKGGKLRWFRDTYYDELDNRALGLNTVRLPSLVAHSFGTYIVGYAMLRYDFLRFDKILLCGSILPIDFPWDVLLERGQVRMVRNEIGAKDVWVRVVRYMVSHTGRSGADGFSREHPRLEQQRFQLYEHSEFFSEGHIEAHWLPFLGRVDAPVSAGDLDAPTPRAFPPFGIYILLIAIIAALFSLIPLLYKTPEEALKTLTANAQYGTNNIDKRDVEIIVEGGKIAEAITIFTGPSAPVKQRQFAIALVELGRFREAYSVSEAIGNKAEIKNVTLAVLRRMGPNAAADSEEWRFLCDVYGRFSDEQRNTVVAEMKKLKVTRRCAWEAYTTGQ
jgi:hypothetical protein